MTRQERIVVLLDNYVDVVNGLGDRKGNGETGLPLMCRAWNFPKQGYPELERLLVQMRAKRKDLYWHMAEKYLRAATRRVLMCANPRCEVTYPTWVKINFHKHGHRNVSLIPRVIRVVPHQVEAAQVRLAVQWLDEQWDGEPFLPDDLLPIAA